MEFLAEPDQKRWMMKILFVMLGGSIRALVRYGVSLFAAQFMGTRFPFGTLIVKLSGCFPIALLLPSRAEG